MKALVKPGAFLITLIYPLFERHDMGPPFHVELQQTLLSTRTPLQPLETLTIHLTESILRESPFIQLRNTLLAVNHAEKTILHIYRVVSGDPEDVKSWRVIIQVLDAM